MQKLMTLLQKNNFYILKKNKCIIYNMEGGFRYRTTIKKKSKSRSKNRLYKSNSQKLIAGKIKKLKKMYKLKISKNIKVLKKMKKMSKYRKSRKSRKPRKSRKSRKSRKPRKSRKSRKPRKSRSSRMRKRHCKSKRHYKQRGGNSLDFTYLDDINNVPLANRMPAVVDFNTNQGFGAAL